MTTLSSVTNGLQGAGLASRPAAINPGVAINKLTVFHPVQFSFLLTYRKSNKILEKVIKHLCGEVLESEVFL